VSPLCRCLSARLFRVFIYSRSSTARHHLHHHCHLPNNRRHLSSVPSFISTGGSVGTLSSCIDGASPLASFVPPARLFHPCIFLRSRILHLVSVQLLFPTSLFCRLPVPPASCVSSTS
jgi:hypothetical protein